MENLSGTKNKVSYVKTNCPILVQEFEGAIEADCPQGKVPNSNAKCLSRAARQHVRQQNVDFPRLFVRVTLIDQNQGTQDEVLQSPLPELSDDELVVCLPAISTLNCFVFDNEAFRDQESLWSEIGLAVGISVIEWYCGVSHPRQWWTPSMVLERGAIWQQHHHGRFICLSCCTSQRHIE